MLFFLPMTFVYVRFLLFLSSRHDWCVKVRFVKESSEKKVLLECVKALIKELFVPCFTFKERTYSIYGSTPFPIQNLGICYIVDHCFKGMQFSFMQNHLYSRRYCTTITRGTKKCQKAEKLSSLVAIKRHFKRTQWWGWPSKDAVCCRTVTQR